MTGAVGPLGPRPRRPGLAPRATSGRRWPGPRPTPRWSPGGPGPPRTSWAGWPTRSTAGGSRRPEARSMLAGALKAGDDGRPLDWDRAAQQYLAIVALDKALAEYDPRYSDPAVRAGLDRMLKELDLPMPGRPSGRDLRQPVSVRPRAGQRRPPDPPGRPPPTLKDCDMTKLSWWKRSLMVLGVVVAGFAAVAAQPRPGRSAEPPAQAQAPGDELQVSGLAELQALPRRDQGATRAYPRSDRVHQVRRIHDLEQGRQALARLQAC